MTMKAWLKIACLGLLIGGYAAGCTITTDDDDEGIGGANPGGGTRATGGRNTSTGGTRNDTGGRQNQGGSDNTGGTTHQGGADQGGAGPVGSCRDCLGDKCAYELDECESERDRNDNGLSDCLEEYDAYQTCVVASSDGYFTPGVRERCSSRAALFDTTLAAPLSTTNDLIDCTASDTPPAGGDCFLECFDRNGGGGGSGPGGAGSTVTPGGAGGEGGAG